MDKICKQYLSDIKKFFPFVGKNERSYLNGLATELEECIENETVTSKFDLYEKYRQPYNVAADYYSSCDTDLLIKKIRNAKYIGRTIVAVVLIGVFVAGMYVLDIIDREKERAAVSIAGSTTVITDPDYIDPEEEGLTIYRQVQGDEEHPYYFNSDVIDNTAPTE